MTTTIKIEFTERTYALDIPGFGRVTIEAIPYHMSDRLASLRLSMAGVETTVWRFAQALINPTPQMRDYLPLLYCAYGDDTNPFLALIGLLEVVFIERDGRVGARHLLQRNVEDDWGGFRNTLVESKHGFALIYEAAAVNFSGEGTIVWEQPLSPHDYLLSHDQNVLQFRSDEFSTHGSGDWVIRRDTGSICKNDSRNA